jgi:hypothetical protein
VSDARHDGAASGPKPQAPAQPPAGRPSASPAPRAGYELAARAAAVIAGLALAVLFGVLGVAILRAPINDADVPAWAGWALRAFIALIFGAFTELGIVVVHGALRGPRAPRVPAPVLARCPACGDARPEGAREGDACTFCGRARDVLARAWSETPRDGLGILLFLGALGGALVSGGIMAGAGATSGKERWFMAIAYAGLALLLTVVGAAMTWGAALAMRDAWQKRNRWELTLSVQDDREAIHAHATVDTGTVSLQGGTERFRPIEDVADPISPEVGLTGPARAVALTLAVLHARGERSLLHAERCEWTVDDRGALVRSREVEVHVSASSVVEETEETAAVGVGPVEGSVEGLVDPSERVLRALAFGVSVRGLMRTLAEHDDLRNAFEVHAEGLPAGEADPRTMRQLAEVLRDGAAAGPYRQAG